MTATATLSKTAAIARARGYVSMPTRRGATDFVVYAPYSSTDPEGPSQEIQRSTYPAAMLARSRMVARIALHLMGKLTDDAEEAIETAHDRGVTDAKSLIEAGLLAA